MFFEAVSKLRFHVFREGEAPAEPQERVALIYGFGSAGASPSQVLKLLCFVKNIVLTEGGRGAPKEAPVFTRVPVAEYPKPQRVQTSLQKLWHRKTSATGTPRPMQQILGIMHSRRFCPFLQQETGYRRVWVVGYFELFFRKQNNPAERPMV
ncbi:MAG: hypothetical protein IH899_12225 [Planctomycetes bacterium]|nr:hypothetical protein [Planctomycetota bacterium]